MKAIILAAGIGSRLGNSNPKPLTKLKNGETILGRQVAYLSEYLGMNNIIAIVGYKKDLIMESFPNLLYVYNNFYDTTNTSKSLLAGLIKIENEDVVWLNGDVVFEKELLPKIIQCSQSCMAVNTNSVGQEEIKYNVFDDGNIRTSTYFCNAFDRFSRYIIKMRCLSSNDSTQSHNSIGGMIFHDLYNCSFIHINLGSMLLLLLISLLTLA